MIKGLRDLSVLGKANRDLLTKIGFDLTLLDLATTKADELDAKYGAASCDSEDYLEVKFSSFFYRTVETVHGAVGEQETMRRSQWNR